MSSLQTKAGAAQSSTVSAPTTQAQAASSSSSLRNLKGSMTLPLQSSVNVGNNLAHIRGLTPLAQLNSPDLRNLGLTSSGVTPFLMSPEFEKLVSQSLTVGITPTSAGGNAPQTPSTFLNPKFVSEEEERFVMNFDEKIKSMIKKEREGGVDENQLNTPVIMDISCPYADTVAPSSGSGAPTEGGCQQPQQQTMFTSTSSAHPLPSAPTPAVATTTAAVAAAAAAAAAAAGSNRHAATHLSNYNTDSDDPMEASCSPDGASGSGGRHLDMSEQEQLKLERKRQRNRDAARKCRERKLERIRFLEERVAELKSQNSRLQRTAVDLREQVKTLQHVIVEHTKRGCSLKDSLSAKLGLA